LIVRVGLIVCQMVELDQTGIARQLFAGKLVELQPAHLIWMLHLPISGIRWE